MRDFFIKPASDAEAETFKQLLPKDWRDELPLAFETAAPAIIYVGISEGEVCVGGIVFPTKCPEKGISQDAQDQLFADGYAYLGYLFVHPEKRGEGFGSAFLTEIRALHPKLWLMCVKELEGFYVRSGWRATAEYVEDNESGVLFVLDDNN